MFGRPLKSLILHVFMSREIVIRKQIKEAKVQVHKDDT